MTFKLFNRTLAFGFRNGCGIDLEFAEGKAIWISQNYKDIQAGAFSGVVVLLPFCSLHFGRCFTELQFDDE